MSGHSGSRTPSKPPTPRLYSYGTHSRSKTHLPHPITLPFPDLPIRNISREGSRSASPAPTPSTIGSALNLNAIPMTAGISSDGLSSPTETPSRSLSPPILNRGGPSASTPQLGVAGPSRLRAQTIIALTRDESTPLSSPLPVSRTQGFNPSPIPPPRTTSPITSPDLPSTLPPQSIPQSRPPSIKEIKPPPPVKKLTNPPVVPPDTVQITPQPNTSVLGDHVYQMFLHGRCADVRIRVEKWQKAWRVHKMVLIQAGFFHSLFLGGFAETSQGSGKGKAKMSDTDAENDWSGEDVDLKFDDPNITLAAFEICLARLYSPHPTLHFPTHHLPTPLQPLSPSYPPSPRTSPSFHSLYQASHPNIHLATPRLLLSLLATTTYLGQAPLMREVLAMVLRTVSPYTVVRYLDFAIGEGIGEEEWEDQDGGGAKGLEDVGEAWKDAARDEERQDDTVEDEDTTVNLDDERPGKDGEKVGYSPVLSRTTSHRSTGSTPTIRPIPNLSHTHESSPLKHDEHLPHFYGFVSNKLGEAVICWLSRWGIDILEYELAFSSEGREGPVIWGRGGIPAGFVRALIGSDGFWVGGEMERYKVGRKVLDLRRKGWDGEMEGEEDMQGWEEEEEGLMRVFEDVYYTHMTFDELSIIVADIDPETSLPYAPLHVIQAAHWSAANLKSRILAAGNAEEEPSDLGLTLSTMEIIAQHSKRRRAPRSRMASPSTSQNTINSSISSSTSTSMSTSNSAHSDLNQLTTPLSSELFHPVPTDDTSRIGAGGLLFLAALASSTTPLPGLPGIPDLGPSSSTSYPSSSDIDPKPKPRPPPQGESTHFGLSNPTLSTSQLLLLPTPSLTTEWTRLPPFRFNVEFWGIHELVEKERAYSRSVFYGGSWWNVYVQTIRKKGAVGGGGQQLGVYLHRQSLGEGFPKVSTSGARRGEQGEKVEVENVDVGEYEDPRRVVKAYFSITCSSALGTALIRFSSSPDSFTISQSWGWKSSALRSEEYLAGLGEGLESGMLGWVGEVPEGGVGGSLRACVVVGLI